MNRYTKISANDLNVGDIVYCFHYIPQGFTINPSMKLISIEGGTLVFTPLDNEVGKIYLSADGGKTYRFTRMDDLYFYKKPNIEPKKHVRRLEFKI